MILVVGQLCHASIREIGHSEIMATPKNDAIDFGRKRVGRRWLWCLIGKLFQFPQFRVEEPVSGLRL